MITSTLGVQLEWNPKHAPGEGRVVASWGGEPVYIWLVEDREAAWLSENKNLNLWFAQRLTRVFDRTFGPVTDALPPTSVVETAEMEPLRDKDVADCPACGRLHHPWCPPYGGPDPTYGSGYHHAI